MTNQYDEDMPLEERVARQAEAAKQGTDGVIGGGRGQEDDLERGTIGAPQGRSQDGREADGVIGAGASGPGNTGQIKDPENWVTGDQPMTDAQRGYLDNLAKQAGETLPADLTKAEASEHIDRLQEETGRDQQTR